MFPILSPASRISSHQDRAIIYMYINGGSETHPSAGGYCRLGIYRATSIYIYNYLYVYYYNITHTPFIRQNIITGFSDNIARY